jgi:glycosyltransferase involved in cell wall biosynthesis
VLPFYDFLIVASHSEAFGRVIIEGIKAGLFVIVRASGGAAELVNKENGYTFRNETELAQLLSAVIVGENHPQRQGKLVYEEADELERLKRMISTL